MGGSQQKGGLATTAEHALCVCVFVYLYLCLCVSVFVYSCICVHVIPFCPPWWGAASKKVGWPQQPSSLFVWTIFATALLRFRHLICICVKYINIFVFVTLFVFLWNTCICICICNLYLYLLFFFKKYCSPLLPPSYLTLLTDHILSSSPHWDLIWPGWSVLPNIW